MERRADVDDGSDRALGQGFETEQRAATSASTDAVDEALKTRAMDEAPVGITIADARSPDMPLVYANAAFERITGYSPEYAVGRNCRFLQGEETSEEPVAKMRAAIEAGRATTVEIRNYRRDGELFWNEVTIAPLRDDDGEVAYYVGFQQDVTRRKRAERAADRRAGRIERERTAQNRLLERLDGVVTDISEAVTRADSRSELERAVAGTIDETYAGAWIGTYDPSDESIRVRNALGSTGGVDSDSRIPLEGSPAESGGSLSDSPVVSAATADAVSGAVADQYVHIEPIDGSGADAVSAVAAVSLHYGDATYGAIGVYAREDPFHSYERAVLTALGRTVAIGINALESQRTLQNESVIEVRLSIGEHPLVSFASALCCRLSYAGSVGDRDRSSMLFEVAATEDDLDTEAVQDAASAVGPIQVHSVLAESADHPVIELSLTGSRFNGLLAEYGAELRELTVGSGEAKLTAEVGRESLAQSLADAATHRFTDAELTGYRRHQQRNETSREFVADLKAELTGRQQAALTRAYTAGYFEWPHEATGEEIAESMNIGRSTFHQHLRAAQRKLAGAIIDRETFRPQGETDR
ncbi:PAS domain-containing protein [Halobellus clavatus]|uniref:PAS domain S-box-containing protein n=1 Tax=Halobellus clavatus TaxID=660517 RepID=A0A1H3GC31_9EURY|nr:PAS domain-containing protein [Halobellus clavatus]SDY00902.1 PAS domain S-box-containing protein [Halobellus clavatus]